METQPFRENPNGNPNIKVSNKEGNKYNKPTKLKTRVLKRDRLVAKNSRKAPKKAS